MAVTKRRNGRLASCEPCRVGKMRCGHEQPICGRCQSRGLAARCFYHAAPLTKPRHIAGISQGALGPGTADRQQLLTPNRTAVHPAFHPQPAVQPDQYSSNILIVQPLRFFSHENDHEKHVQDVIKILGRFRDLEYISWLLQDYTEAAQTSLVPGPMLLYITSTFFDTASKYSLQEAAPPRDGLRSLAELILGNTAKNVDVSPDMDYKAFLDMYTRDNLRIETVGAVLALATRSHIFHVARGEQRRVNFVQEMFEATAMCIDVARVVGPVVNDMIVWLSFEMLRLTSNAQGDSHPFAWRRLGDVSDDVYAMGIHREATNSTNAPFWLAEVRRKSFACAYQYDKMVSTLFERPPRILRRYSDCDLPLDISDDNLVADPHELQSVRSKLTPEGWNAEGQYSSTTWARLRCIMGVTKEEIFDFLYRPLSAQDIVRLKDLSQRCHAQWNSLPPTLRHDPGVWDTGIVPGACLMLAIINLNHLQNDYQIHRMLARYEPAYTGGLLKVSAEIIGKVVHLGNVRDRDVFLRHDNSYVMLAYGLPSAAVLVHAMSKSGVGTLPDGLSRSKLIRDLSVFVSYLESICTPDDANYTVCTQAAKTIAQTLDEILDPQAGSTSVRAELDQDTAPAATGESGVPDAAATADQTTILPGNEELSMPELDFYSTLDLDNWIKSIDWTGVTTGTQWGF